MFLPGLIEKIQFKIIGIVSSCEYQKSKFIAEQLGHTFPDRFAQSILTPMLDVAWNEYRNRIGRLNLYGMGVWCSEEPVMVFLENTNSFIGDSKALEKFIDKNYILRIYRDFETMALLALKKFIENSRRPYVYFIISILGQTIGTLLFELYTDAVPETCENFLKLVGKKRGGYQGTPVHRICKSSWVQFGGFKLKPKTMPCENYSIAHNARGVISMCNDGKHKNNSTQFFVSLDPTPWMDYYYVAFGKLVHGESILQQIENMPTSNECPTVPIIIEECGIFKMDNQPSYYLSEQWDKYQKRLEKVQMGTEDHPHQPGIYPLDFADPRDAVSQLTITKYNQKMYSI